MAPLAPPVPTPMTSYINSIMLVTNQVDKAIELPDIQQQAHFLTLPCFTCI